MFKEKGKRKKLLTISLVRIYEQCRVLHQRLRKLLEIAMVSKLYSTTSLSLHMKLNTCILFQLMTKFVWSRCFWSTTLVALFFRQLIWSLWNKYFPQFVNIWMKELDQSVYQNEAYGPLGNLSIADIFHGSFSRKPPNFRPGLNPA